MVPLLLGILAGLVPPTAPAGGPPPAAGPVVVSGPSPAAGPAPTAGPAPATRPGFAILHMNVCLSGQAGCYGETDYPSVVDETVERIAENRVDAVTLNEACHGDVAAIAERTGYDYRFVMARYAGAPLPCIDPEGRGLFGLAVLAAEPIRSASQGVFPVRDDPEERRWLCVTTAHQVDVCTSHLSTGADGTGLNNARQCEELSALLDARRNPTVFAGDVNRRGSCAPPGFWTLTDARASQAPGIQHAYGSLSSPSLELEETEFTDHDALVVRARVPRT